MKVRNHNEWFRTVDRPKHCPSCHRKAQVWVWGQYVHGRWNNVSNFCEHCWGHVAAQLRQHQEPCGCTITLMGYGGRVLPEWLSLDNQVPCTMEVCN